VGVRFEVLGGVRAWRGDVEVELGDHVAESAELRAALALWKGAPLAGVRGDYAESERIRLGQLRLAAIEDLAAADLGLGRHVEAAAALAPLIDEHPLHERPRELLMLALYRSGRQADALAVYSDTRRLLADKLGSHGLFSRPSGCHR
jgi:DNA-binding SARP family transcriptional activator